MITKATPKNILMNTDAIIYNEWLDPYIEPLFSRLSISVIIPAEDRIVHVQDFGTIKQLGEKYEFDVENDKWDLRSMHKRDCMIKEENGKYIFLNYK